MENKDTPTEEFKDTVDACEACDMFHDSLDTFQSVNWDNLERTFDAMTEKASFLDRVKLFFWRHKNAKFLLDEQSLAIIAATAFGGVPGKASAVQTLVAQLGARSDELMKTTMELTFSNIIRDASVAAANRFSQELAARDAVIEKALADLERVRSESKIIRSIKADLKAALPADNDAEGKAAAEQAEAA